MELVADDSKQLDLHYPKNLSRTHLLLNQHQVGLVSSFRSTNNGESSSNLHAGQSKSIPIAVRSSKPQTQHLGQAAMWVKSSWQVSAERFCSCVFINMFHSSRAPSTIGSESSFKASLKLFARSYLRNWKDHIDASISKHDIRFIETFKSKYPKIQREEWKYLNSILRQSSIEISPESLRSFGRILEEHHKTQMETVALDGSSQGGLLHQYLRNSSLGTESICELDIISLYFCVYFENYEELWNTKSVILQASMIDSIEQFILENPIINNSILNSLMYSIDKYTIKK